MSESGSKIPSNHDVRPHEDEDFYRLTLYEALGISEGATAEDIKVGPSYTFSRKFGSTLISVIELSSVLIRREY